MHDRRTSLLEGAIEVLGAGGSRALTHRAVDAAAGAPPGSASNHFRTRDALLIATLEHLLATEATRYRAIETTGPGADDPEALVREAAAMVDALTGPLRARTVARLALSLEVTWEPRLGPMLEQGRRTWHATVADRLRRLGVEDPGQGADGVLSLFEGLVLERLRGAGLDGASAQTAMRALLRGLDVAAPEAASVP